MNYNDIPRSEWISSRSINMNTKRSMKPPVDTEVSKILGKEILAQDPRLLALIIKFKSKYRKGEENLDLDNFLLNADFIKELKQTFA